VTRASDLIVVNDGGSLLCGPAFPSSPATYRLAVADGQVPTTPAGNAWMQRMRGGRTDCASSHSSSVWVQDPFPQVTAAPPPGLALDRANAQARGDGRDQGEQDEGEEEYASGAPALHADRARCLGEQTHELGKQVASLGAHQLAELGRRRRSHERGSPLGADNQ
jgi:hypothetical protein